MLSEQAEIVIKVSSQIAALRADRQRLTAEIDRKIMEAEFELSALLGLSKSSSKSAAMEPLSKQEQVASMLRGNPKTSHAELALEVYGEDTPENRSRLRATIYAMRQKGTLEGSAEDGYVVR